MVRVPYRGVPKKDTVEPKAEPPIRRPEPSQGEGAQRVPEPPIRRARSGPEEEKIGDGTDVR